MSLFLGGFVNELEKLGSVAGVIGTALASRSLSNLVSHMIVNTKASPEFIRTALGKVGKGFLSLGFKHGIEGRALRSTAKAAISTATDPSLIATYNAAWGIGDKVRRTVSKIPFADGKTPFKAVQLADSTSRGAIKSAPFVGAIGGGIHGYNTDKSKRHRNPTKSIAANALAGGLLGLGVRAYGPSAPVIKQMHYLRKNVADKVLSGGKSKIIRALDGLTIKTSK